MSDNLSQEDIDRLLAGMSDDGALGGGDGGQPPGGGLNQQEKETLGEICTMSMGAGAATLSEIINNRVDISSPTILDFNDISEVLGAQDASVIVELNHTGGLNFTSLLFIKNHDFAVIADIMMGGSGQVEVPEIGDIQLSAVSEAINQMMTSTTANLSTIFERQIALAPPSTQPYVPGSQPTVPPDMVGSPVVGIIYKINIGALVDSELLQIFKLDTAQEQVQLFLGSVDSLLQGDSDPGSAMPSVDMGGVDPGRMFGNQPGMEQGGGMGFGGMSQDPVTIQPARFSSLDGMQSMMGEENKNLELVLDVALRLTVELGRAELPIKKVLELTRGSVIELDKIAGEPVDLLANGKLIAKGEVVVIEDNFGLRITSIISPADRLKNL